MYTLEEPPELNIGGAEVQVFPSFYPLGVHIKGNLNSDTNCISLVKNAHHCLHFLGRLKQAGLGTTILTSCVPRRAPSPHVSLYGMETAHLKRVVKSAQKICGCCLTAVNDIYIRRCRSRAAKIMNDSTHSAHGLFTPKPSCRRL